MNTSIFEYLNPNNNDIFHYKDKDEIKNLLILINKYNLPLRNKLNFDNKTTFGFEFEFEDANLEMLNIDLETYIRTDWELKPDGTVPTGGEVTTPILYDSVRTWQDISDVCKIISRYSHIDSDCGSHIHIGNQIIENEDNFVNLIKTWIAFEDIIFRFTYGEYTNNRPNILQYAKPIAKEIVINSPNLDYDYIFGNASYSPSDSVHLKGYKFDIYSKDNTIEFRCPNGTLNPIIWQNNLNLFINLIKYAKEKYNEKQITKVINYNKKKYNQYQISRFKLLDMYSDIDLIKVLYMSDIIFDNNLDKIYFLRQYLKSFEREKVYKKAKQFTQI